MVASLQQEKIMHFKRILVPTDFSPGAEAALENAIDLARSYGATVVLMHCYGLPTYSYPDLGGGITADYMSALEQYAREMLGAILEKHKDAGVPIATALYAGVPWEQILRAIGEHSIGLVVIGTHGRRGIAHALLGSVAEKVVRLSPVPVLTVRAPAEPAASPATP
jgi:nucleotide-binding universal stress UspA family protein